MPCESSFQVQSGRSGQAIHLRPAGHGQEDLRKHLQGQAGLEALHVFLGTQRAAHHVVTTWSPRVRLDSSGKLIRHSVLQLHFVVDLFQVQGAEPELGKPTVPEELHEMSGRHHQYLESQASSPWHCRSREQLLTTLLRSWKLLWTCGAEPSSSFTESRNEAALGNVPPCHLPVKPKIDPKVRQSLFWHQTLCAVYGPAHARLLHHVGAFTGVLLKPECASLLL